jgi:restriction system protein
MTNLISAHGGYRRLKSYQAAEIAYDLTFEFVKRYVPSFKEADQIEGAARGGKQNIAEGSQTSGTSKQSELRLVHVARASLEELKNDYEDVLRKNGLPKWGRDDARTAEIRNLAYAENRTHRTYMTYMTNRESAANCLLCVVNQACYLLDKQLEALSRELGRGGDFKERYAQVRKEKVLGGDDAAEYEKLLAENGMRRLADGRVVPIEGRKKEE